MGRWGKEMMVVWRKEGKALSGQIYTTTVQTSTNSLGQAYVGLVHKKIVCTQLQCSSVRHKNTTLLCFLRLYNSIQTLQVQVLVGTCWEWMNTQCYVLSYGCLWLLWNQKPYYGVYTVSGTAMVVILGLSCYRAQYNNCFTMDALELA